MFKFNVTFRMVKKDGLSYFRRRRGVIASLTLNILENADLLGFYHTALPNYTAEDWKNVFCSDKS